MTYTDTSEKGLESLIISQLIDTSKIAEPKYPFSPAIRIPNYIEGVSTDFDRDHAVDLNYLLQFLKTTQHKTYNELSLDEEGTSREKFLHRLQGEIAKRGVIDVLRKGFS